MKRKNFALATLFFTVIFMLAGYMTGICQSPADSVAVNTGIGAMLPASWKPFMLAALGIYDVIVRIFPTTKNLSISGNLIKLWQTILPNKNGDTPTKPHA